MMMAPPEKEFSSTERNGVFVTDVVHMVLTQSRTGCITSVEFRDTDFWKFRWVGICRVKTIKLHGRLEVNLDRGDNVNGKSRVKTCIDSVPRIAYCIRPKQGVQVFMNCS